MGNQSSLQIFNNETFGRIEVVIIDGKEWFGATQVAKALGYANPHDAISKHCRRDGVAKREVVTTTTNQHGVTTNQKVNMNFINEGNLYRLIVKSRRPEAEAFETWVFEEVLPTIRKTGGYVANDELFIETYLPHADEQTRTMFRATLETVRKQNETIAVMAPKADYFDALVERNLLTNFQTTAKELKVNRNELIEWLLKNGYIFRNKRNVLEPYAQYVPELFEIKEWTRNGTSGIQSLITPKGRETIRLLMRK